LETTTATPTSADFEDGRYKAALGGAIRKLREIGVRQALVDKYIAQKGEKWVVKTILYCIERDAKGEIKSGLRPYMMKSLNDCGWTVRKVAETIKKLQKGSGCEAEFKKFDSLEKAVRYELLGSVAQMANKKGLTRQIEIFDLAVEAVSNLKYFFTQKNQ
jgi:hypothetical protein